ncbi:unnamed protein product [Linum trigynum]|uniref:Neprosin PEP catalytic domain-containing protein n=1 Tax=Linum trigynum TaxID=586398 RepID=A0AAV2EC21_9ROSI
MVFGKSRKQFSNVDRPVVATIQTIHGDTYNCMDFYHQPAFDHPALKNRKFNFQMINSYYRGLEVRATNSTSYGDEPSYIWLNGKGCPIGTVPIRKTAISDLHKANLDASLASNLNPGVHVAVLRSTGDKRYHGGGMWTTVYSHNVGANQYTSSRVKLENGLDSIAVGWTVNPSLYQDSQTRLFIYTNTKDVHCYNTFCPGFVLTNHEIPLDVVLRPVSKRGGPIFIQNFNVSKDLYSGDWVFRFGPHNKVLGFWPTEIFNGLANYANYVEWGGEVYSPPGTVIPPMGSGCRPYGDTKLDGYASSIRIVDENDVLDYNPADCEIYQDDRVHYGAIDKGNVGGSLQRLFEFGGNSLLYDPSAPFAC